MKDILRLEFVQLTDISKIFSITLIIIDLDLLTPTIREIFIRNKQETEDRLKKEKKKAEEPTEYCEL